MKISVLMPVYNAKDYVSDALQSILPQLEKGDEVLVLDDGSTDGSPEVIQSINDPRILFHQNERNLGVAQTLNRGLQMAQGEYVLRLDADDLCHPSRVRKQIGWMDAHPEVGVCGSWIRLFGDQRPFVEYRPIEAGSLSLFGLFENPFHHPSVVLRKSVIDEHSFSYTDGEFNRCEDFELWSRMSKVTGFHNLPEPLVNVRLHAQSVTTTTGEVMENQTRKVLDRELKALGVSLTQDEMIYHRTVSHGVPATDPADVGKACDWLIEFKQRLSEPGNCDLKRLENSIGWIWYRYCSNALRFSAEVDSHWKRIPMPDDLPGSLRRQFAWRKRMHRLMSVCRVFKGSTCM